MITPLELLNKEFSVRMRGYDRSEVDEFLSLLQKDYETLFRYYRKNCGSDAIVPPKPEELEPAEARPASQEPQQAKTEAESYGAAPDRPAAGGPPTHPAPGQEADLAESIKGILAMAQKVAEESRRAAESEAAAIISGAEADAARLAAAAEEKLRAAERRLADLASQESALRARMKGYLEVYRQLIEDFEATSGIDYSL